MHGQIQLLSANSTPMHTPYVNLDTASTLNPLLYIHPQLNLTPEMRTVRTKAWGSLGRILKIPDRPADLPPHDPVALGKTPIKNPPHLEIHGWDAETATANINPTQLALWREIPHPKILLYT